MNPELQLILWVIGSVALGTAVTAYLHRAGNAWRYRALIESDLGAAASEVAAFMFYVGLPFLALIAGAVSLDLLGLGSGVAGQSAMIAGFSVLSWVRAGAAAALAVGFVLVVLWIALRSAPDDSSATQGQPGALLIMRDAAYAEAHWAFYRAPLVLLLDEAVWGAAAGSILVAGEWLLHSRLRREFRRESPDRVHALILACCVITSGLLYVLTRNIWVMIVAQAAIRWVGAQLSTRMVRLARPTP